jgi:integrase
MNSATTNPRLNEIISYGLWMRKEGYRESTCYFSVRTLKRLDRKANVLEPEAVKRFLANSNWTDGGKQRITEDLDRFYRFKGVSWEQPRYEAVDILPHIPREADVNELISGLSGPVGTFSLLLKETGCRPCEGWAAEWTHTDMGRNTIVIRAGKKSRSRELRISNQLVGRLNQLPKISKYVFHDGSKDAIKGLKDFTRKFQKERKRITTKCANPKLQLISLRTLRHYKGTMEYHRTRDIVYVQKLLGHRSIQNTLRYVRLVNFPDDEFTSMVATDQKQITQLIEAGYEFVLQKDGLAYFRKRK